MFNSFKQGLFIGTLGLMSVLAVLPVKASVRPVCQPVLNTPTPTTTATPTPTIIITPTPIASPSATPVPEQKREEPSAPTERITPECKTIPHAPTIIKVKRLAPDSVSLEWTRVADYVNTYLIWYGPTEKLMLWNTFVTGQYTELHFLPLNQPIWAKVAGTHESCIGPFSLTIDP